MAGSALAGSQTVKTKCDKTITNDFWNAARIPARFPHAATQYTVWLLQVTHCPEPAIFRLFWVGNQILRQASVSV
ncbi:hypothetical protein LGH82_31495 [Mesorhizobium sp. PAMC28654]|uniref:hypothetical protein n=1 Tax=Mesorhizobium sp. PAMC28654 TaxID=2880934 RepID=UPI001D0B8745|nr:hypothetical protein [Mesorhizobium sp. PAMC28654]UDL89527.1 hypothetical protein LGH82_31495 [Mesorhizobium sp. PAMC28654]